MAVIVTSNRSSYVVKVWGPVIISDCVCLMRLVGLGPGTLVMWHYTVCSEMAGKNNKLQGDNGVRTARWKRCS